MNQFVRSYQASRWDALLFPRVPGDESPGYSQSFLWNDGTPKQAFAEIALRVLDPTLIYSIAIARGTNATANQGAV
jgi:hypothetical protein